MQSNTSMPNLLMQSTTTPPKCCLTANDHLLFKGNSTTLINKQFLLKEGDGDILYKVTEVRFLKGSWEYIVQFKGCSDCINMLGQEMIEMLNSSSFIKVDQQRYGLGDVYSPPLPHSWPLTNVENPWTQLVNTPIQYDFVRARLDTVLHWSVSSEK